MKPEDWLERWETGHTPFHTGEVNPVLQRFESELLGDPARRVLVPLCGKSVDMAWLAGHGHDVVGVELSVRAIEAFFAENDLPFTVESEPGFRVLRGDRIALWSGDFLDVTPEHLGTFDAVWDRAALIALPPAVRRDYARVVQALMRPDARQLLVTLDYDEGEMDGPPFAVTANEVAAIYADMDVRVLASEDGRDGEGPLASAGLSRLTRTAYLLTPRSPGAPA